MTDVLERTSVTDQFHVFSDAVHRRYTELSSNELFVVDVEDIFATYLAAFPEGTNPIFRERTEHDCSCCKHFVRNLGRVVALKDGEVMSVWDDLGDLPHPYNEVARRMSETVRQAPVLTVFRTKEGKFGTASNFDTQTERKWFHFHGTIASKHQCADPATKRSDLEAVAQVMRRGLDELKPDAIETILDLIDSNSLYRGEEHKAAVYGFRDLQRRYQAAANKSAFVWENLQDRSARFRNTVIGTLAVDLSEGVDLERAVRSFETKVAPTNYKRPTALITPKMIEQAMATLKELGLEEAVERRFARLSDISVNNVLFVDNAVRGQMKGGLTDLLMKEARQPKVDTDKATDISADTFLSEILPKTKTLSVLLQNTHLNNFVSLTAPAHENTGRLFKWDNDFAWSYDGEVTDSIKERVKRAGGNVTNAALRVSLAWYNYDDLDLHVRTPNGEHYYYGNKGNILDVDMNAGLGRTREPVENLSWTPSRLRDGTYTVWVNQFCKRENTNIGFAIEVENAGRLQQFSYDKAVVKDVQVATITMRGGVIADMKIAPGLIGGSIPTQKWGVTTESLVPVDTLMLSPNYWDGQGVGNRHLFFILRDCKNPDPVRGIYNEFLRSTLDKHRKVFEVLGAKTKCPPSDDQLSGVGFSSTRGDRVTVVADGRAFNIGE